MKLIEHKLMRKTYCVSYLMVMMDDIFSDQNIAITIAFEFLPNPQKSIFEIHRLKLLYSINLNLNY